MEEPISMARTTQGGQRDTRADRPNVKANPLWGAPRIHGELLKLGINVSQATASKYMVRQRKPPPQSRQAFLANHAHDIVSIAFFTVPTAAWTGLPGPGPGPSVLEKFPPFQIQQANAVVLTIRRLGMRDISTADE